MKTLLIIDGDHVTFRSAASCEPTKAKPEREDLTFALARAEFTMKQILQDCNATEYELYISGEGNWRCDIYPEYKANRKDKPRPMWLQEVREYLVINWNAKIVNDIEVDDICGIRLTEENELGPYAICVSLDKDLLTIPGKHYNFVTKTFSTVSPLQAMRRFYSMVIEGDAADHIPAFDGKFRSATPMFVQKLLDPLQEMTTAEEMYEHCAEVYSDSACWSELWRETMHRNASVLFIQTKEGEQWRVPNGQAQD